MPLYTFENVRPKIDPSAYIAPTATIVGNVTIGKDSSVWFNCVVRGDADTIIIGEETNIQDLTMVHADQGKPTIVGNKVTVGHHCVLHGCIIEDNCLIGMGSIILNGAKIGRGSVVAAGAVVTEDTVVPSSSLIAGIPGKVKRTFEENSMGMGKLGARAYMELAKSYSSSDKLELIG